MPDTPLMIAVDIVVGLLFLVGLAGAVLPFVPGPVLILAGAVVYAAVTGFTVIGGGRLVVLTALAALAWLLAHLVSVVGARRYGGSRWAVAGALVGALAGVALGPLGVVAGPVVGAVLFELGASGELRRSLRSGLGTLLGFVVGVVAQLTLGVLMIVLFLWWVRSGVS